MEKFITKNSEETIVFGKRLARKLKKGDIICFFGDLGSGKTTMIKGIAEGLRIDPSEVNSPTFVLMNIYEGRLPLYHYDFYRLDDLNDINAIGYDEYIYGEGVSVIEWADRLGKFMPEEYLRIDLKHKEVNKRVIQLSGKGNRYINVVNGKW